MQDTITGTAAKLSYPAAKVSVPKPRVRVNCEITSDSKPKYFVSDKAPQRSLIRSLGHGGVFVSVAFFSPFIAVLGLGILYSYEHCKTFETGYS